MAKVEKPWGYYQVLYKTDNLLVKKIVINPGHCTSKQYHILREETWFRISGEWEVRLNNGHTVYAYENIHIEKSVIHQIINNSDEELHILEVQSGICDEDDIVRLEDPYEDQR